jgi:hypothetical protein
VFAVGSSLREARERQGLELIDAEAATKIRAKYLKALEDETFDLLPAQTYVKGFLRSYADYLGLDGQLYVDEFNSRFASGDDELPAVASPRRPTPRSGRQVESAVVLVVLAGIAAIAALVVVAWKWGGSPAERPRLAAPPASPQPAAERRRSGPEWIRVSVRAARGDSWMRVRRGKPEGKTLFRRVLRRGDEESFVGARVYMLVSHPQNLEIRLDGERVRLPRGENRLLATPRGVRPTPAPR